MNVTLEFSLNGKSQRVSTDSRRSLLEVLREDLGFTGTKYGCGEGQCRACTVLVDNRPVQSCLASIGTVENRNVQTIEGLAKDGQLHPVQKAFLEEGAMQCGYCVPGMIMTTVGMIRRMPNATKPQIMEALGGNLCRCCGYIKILKAAERAAAERKEASK